MTDGKSKLISFASPVQIKVYRIWLLILLSSLIVGYGFMLYGAIAGKGSLYPLYFPPIIIFKLFRIYQKIKAVEFDSEFLYVYERGFDIVMPLENIKNIEIKSLNGYYVINLLDPVQSGSKIYFTPSMIYPLDFNKQDDKVNLLRTYIRNAKRHNDPLPENALNS